MQMMQVAKRMVNKTSNAPFHFTLFVTNKCNNFCQHCFYWESLNQPSIDELKVEEIEKMSKSMGKIFTLLLTGGETYLRKELPQIVKTFYDNNKIKNLITPTNGMMTKQVVQIVTQILEECPKISYTVQISLDGLEELHDEIRKVKGCFKRAVKTHKELMKLSEKYPNLKVTVASCINKLNQDTIDELYYYVRDELKSEFALTFLRGSPKNPKLVDIDSKKYKNLYKEVESHDENRGKRIGLKHLTNYENLKKFMRYKMNAIRINLITDTYDKGKFITPCYAGSLNAVMYENGDLYPCELLGTKKIGNIREVNYNFQTLWNSDKAKEYRKWILDSKCFCTHECYYQQNIMFNPKMLGRMVFGKD